MGLLASALSAPFAVLTFVDTSKVRKKRDFGLCYRRAGWRVCGRTKGGLLSLRLAPEDMPQPVVATGRQEVAA